MPSLNYFALEPIVVAQLKAEIPELAEVYTPFDVDQMLQLTNISPSASVIYVGDRVSGSVGSGEGSAIYQQWLLVLSLNDAAAQLEQTNSIRAAAAPLIHKLLMAFQGYCPALTPFGTFKRVQAGVEVGSDDSGNAYFPFLFEIEVFI